MTIEKVLNMYETINRTEELDSFLELAKTKKVCIFAFGAASKFIYSIFNEMGVNIDFFCDNDPQKVGQEYFGVKCQSFEYLKENKDDTVVFISTSLFKEIETQLSKENILYFKNLGYKLILLNAIKSLDVKSIRDECIKAYNLFEDELSKEIFLARLLHWITTDVDFSKYEEQNQYFDTDIIKVTENEVFLDGGSYDGDTIKAFFNFVNNKFKKVISFEMNQDSYNLQINNIAKLPEDIAEKVVVYNKGISDSNRTIYYYPMGTSSKINNIHGIDMIRLSSDLVRIDDICTNDAVTFIKMDLEGSELSALQGAEQTIVKNKPKLAICVYHKVEDPWVITNYIKRLVPEYKLYLRHYSSCEYETVLYATL
ncbi:hypothetical protein CLHUN_05890 [Ruminiclostridium hungatei]|uniref:Methyltransferase FkbM domain-containing protein n=1 Tax=Ruminiclostridium hungatei TaxID=48256 RepID=A0A1V4SP55_RUMHU|nr:FkbM family methyltransferase [Ruminiclostridium hungatei]OPX45652.1 hypothetical protein CLHUN_05890 [Ruminiclostridium hungatei]